MKHPQANITVEGQGWNPYAVAAEGKEAFTERVIADGHYQRGDDEIPMSEDERKTIAGHVFDKATEFVAKEKAKADEKKRKAAENEGNQAVDEKGPEQVVPADGSMKAKKGKNSDENPQ